MSETIDKVPFSKLKKLVEQIEKQPHLEDKLDETEISLELIIGSLFPNAYNNLLDKLKDEHTRGYIEGFNSGISQNPNTVKFEAVSCPNCGAITYVDLDDYGYPKYCPDCGEQI